MCVRPVPMVALGFALGILTSCGSGTQPQSGQSSENPLRIEVAKVMTGAPNVIEQLGALEVSLPISATMDPEIARQMVESDWVSLEFSEGEKFVYQNAGGLAIIDGDVIYAMSGDMPNLAASYHEYVTHEKPVERDKPVAQSTIGKRGFICTFRFFGCWVGFNNIPAWPNGNIYFQIGSSVSGTNDSGHRRAILDAVAKWNIDTGGKPRWIHGMNPSGPTTTFVQMPSFFGSLFSGLSPIGYTQHTRIPYVYIVDGFFNTNVITHEMGHAAGLNHEHQRCDRNSYLQMNLSWWERTFNFPNWSPICEWGEDIGPFNYDSLMMYRSEQVVPRPIASNYVGNPNLAYFRGDTSNMNSPSRGLDVRDVQDGLRALYP